MRILKLFMLLLLFTVSSINVSAQCSMTYVSQTAATCGNATGSVTFNGLPAENWRIEATSISVDGISFPTVTGSTETVTLTGLVAGVGYKFRLITDASCVSDETSEVIIASPTGCNVNEFTVVATPHNEVCGHDGAVILNIVGVIPNATLDFTFSDGRPDESIVVPSGATSVSHRFEDLDTGSYTYSVVQSSSSVTSSPKTETVTILDQTTSLVFNVDEEFVNCAFNYTVNVTTGSAVRYRIVNATDATDVIRPWQTYSEFAGLTVTADQTYKIQVEDECGEVEVKDIVLKKPEAPKFGYTSYAEMTDCSNMNIQGVLQSGDFAYPVDIQAKQYNSSNNLLNTSAVVTMATGGKTDPERTFNLPVPFTPQSGLYAIVSATDACGTTVTKRVNWGGGVNPIYSVTTKGADCGGSYVELGGTRTGFYGNTTIEFTSYPSGFVPSNYEGGTTYFPTGAFTSSAIPQNVIVSMGSSSNSLPDGNYTITIKDECAPAHERTRTFSIDSSSGTIGLTPSSGYFYAGCEEGYGSHFIGFYSGGNLGSPVYMDITKVTLTGGTLTTEELTVPTGASFPVETAHMKLVDEIPVYGTPQRGSGVYFGNLPEGTYTAQIEVGPGCGSTNSYTYTFDITGKSILKNDVTVEPLCANFNLTFDFIGNISSPKFYLQKKNADGNWTHPVNTGHIYPAEPTTTDLSDWWGIEATLTQGTSSTNAEMKNLKGEFLNLNNITNPNGDYRVVVQYQNRNWGTKGNSSSGLNSCIQVLNEFSYNYTKPEIIDYYVIKCSGGESRIIIDALGAEPLTYEIYEINGVEQNPVIKSGNNGKDPIFFGLTEEGEYKVRIIDGCLHERLLTINTATSKLPFIKKEGFCPNQNSRLYIDGLHYMTFNWTKDGNPITSSNVTAYGGVLTFTPFDPTTDSGTYRLQLNYDTHTDVTCTNILEIKVDGSSYLPNAGTNGTLNICAGITPSDADLFDALGGTPETGGAWSSGSTSSGVTTYTYTLSKTTSCGPGTATATVTVTEQTVPKPTISSTPATCSSAEVSTISNYVSGLNYTFSPTGPTVGTAGAITGMTQGTAYTVTASNGTCTSTASDSFSNDAMLSAPAKPTVGAITQPTCSVATGSFQIENYSTNNTYTFTPSVVSISNTGLVTANEGTYTFTVKNTDECTSEASDEIEISKVCNTTVAEDDINNTFVNTPVSGDVSTNDYDVEGNTQSITAHTNPSNGNLVFDNTTGKYTYTPNTDFVGIDTFTYTLCDNGTPRACDEATVTIEVIDVPTPEKNNPPVANNDTNITEVNTPVAGSLLPNDYDPDGDEITINTTPIENPTNGAVTINEDGTYTYTPNNEFVGEDTFVYEICDNGNPKLCDQATVTITVLPKNPDNSTVANDDAYNGNMNETITGKNVLDNDYDPENDTQTVNTTPVSAPMNGSVVLNEDGTFVYTPNDNYSGTDQFIYEVCDDNPDQACTQATVYITINPVNATAPKIALVKAASYDKATDVITYTFSVTNTGDVTVSNLTISDEKLGLTNLTVIPSVLAPNATGTATATYTVTQADLDAGSVTNIAIAIGKDPDGNDVTDTSGTDIDNDTPTISKFEDNTTKAEDDISNADVNIPVSGNVLTNDYDAEGDIQSITGHTKPNHGILEFDEATGEYTYTPNADFVGTDTFTYTICDDGTPQACDEATVTIHISCPNFGAALSNIPQLLSPNGDGKNDVWNIPELATRNICNQSNKVMIFNRWGAKVWNKENYMSDSERFAGYSENSLDFNDSELLPAGTYFYIIEIDGNIEKTGYLYIVHN